MKPQRIARFHRGDNLGDSVISHADEADVGPGVNIPGAADCDSIFKPGSEVAGMAGIEIVKKGSGEP